MTEGSASLKTIYIEFENDLTTINKAAVENMKLGHGKSLVVSCKPIVYDVDNYEGNRVINTRYEFDNYKVCSHADCNLSNMTVEGEEQRTLV